jgi:hypothetical protein
MEALLASIISLNRIGSVDILDTPWNLMCGYWRLCLREDRTSMPF